MKQKRVLVLGGSGFVGQQVCERLVAQGHRVSVPTRRATSARNVQLLPLLDVVEAQVHDPVQLNRVVAGHDAVVNLIAILHGNGAAFDRVHVQLPKQIAAACALAGIERLVHVSALGCSESPPSLYLRSKSAGEAALIAQGLSQLAIVRPSVIFGADDKLLNLFAKLQAIFPMVPLAGADSRFQPVWVGDVADLLVKLAVGHGIHSPDSYTNSSDKEAYSITEAAGPDVMTLRDIVAISGRLSGNPRPIVSLPRAIANIQAFLMELAPGEPLMSRDNLASMQTPNVASGKLPGLADFGIHAQALSTIAPLYLGGNGPRAYLDTKRRTH